MVEAIAVDDQGQKLVEEPLQESRQDEGYSRTGVKKRPGLEGDDVSLDDFKVIKVISSEAEFGKIYLVKNFKIGKAFAARSFKKDLLLEEDYVGCLKNEKDILFTVDHPFVNSLDYVA